jgi:glycyl-tRNA synthetase
VGLDAAILMHPKVWEASGHVENFTDPLVDCKTCKGRFREDQIDGSRCPQKPSKTPKACGGELMPARKFNLMFKTHMGPVEETGSVCYLRPETAQGIYVNFLNVMAPSRQGIPFGIAQIGKAFRNEISPGNFIFRSREFEQMEMQFFVKPGTDAGWFDRWRDARMAWHKALGLAPSRLRFKPHETLAHYAKAASDIEFEYPFGWQELEGIHNRTDFDLKRHMEFSGKDLSVFDEETKQRYVPYIIETSVGADRLALATLVNGYVEEEVKPGDSRTVLKLHPAIAPIKAAILPLVNRDGMPEIAQKVAAALRRDFKVFYDDGGAIGRRYRRMDEAGTPFCITVDGDTLKDQTVTIRERDSMAQSRVPIAALAETLRRHTAFVPPPLP